MKSKFTPLRAYEGFASDLTKRAGDQETFEEITATMTKGLFYLLTFTVDYDPSKNLPSFLSLRKRLTIASDNQNSVSLVKKLSRTKRKGTLFKCQVYLALRHTNWGHCKLKLIQSKFNQMQVFEERGKPEYPGENLSEQRREPTN